ncbi:hypothetical protein CFP56_038862 [Quercus suber]|uniref:Uncharacterized protein n=1 Tax=Quercus suber TaxID=58331 RepID=A0AAW0LN71_QUESU
MINVYYSLGPSPDLDRRKHWLRLGTIANLHKHVPEEVHDVLQVSIKALTAYFVGFRIVARNHLLSYDIKYKSHGRVEFLALHCSWNKAMISEGNGNSLLVSGDSDAGISI